MKVQKTSKLFFGKYVNKVVIAAPLAALFRERDLTKVKLTLDQYDKLLAGSPTGYVEFNSRWSRRKYSHKDIFQAYKIRDRLLTETNYSIRVEGIYLGVYSNDNVLIDDLSKINPELTDAIIVADKKSREFLLNNIDTIIVKKKTHKYKIRLGALGDRTDSFMEWAEKHPGIKIFKKATVYKWGGGIIYVSNDKNLTLCKLYIGDRITKIDRVIQSDEI